MMRSYRWIAAAALAGAGVAGMSWSAQTPGSVAPDRGGVRYLVPSPQDLQDLAAARKGLRLAQATGSLGPITSDKANMAAIAISKTPVLILPSTVGVVKIISWPDHYVATAAQAGAQYELHGTIKVFAGPAPKSAGKLQPTANGFSNLRVEKSEIGQEVTFTRFGALYDLSISCDDPDHDPRCGEAQAAAMAMSAVYVGGGQ